MIMKKIVLIAAALMVIASCHNNKTNDMQLTQEWDKVFPKSDLVDHQKVTFKNRYGITLAADMYTPKNADGKLPAIAAATRLSCSTAAIPGAIPALAESNTNLWMN